MTHNIITIDGPAASGKGTVARRLANHLDYFYFDTGKLYRQVGLLAYHKGLNPETDIDAIVALAVDLERRFDIQSLDNPELKSDIAGQWASKTSIHPPVRQAVLHLQKHLADNPPQGEKGTVLDGRDCGTVIAPHAPHKFFIIADVTIRAKRRYDEMIALGEDADLDDILNEMKIRDDRDTNRATSPLKPAEHAMTIDTSSMSADSVFEKILSAIKD